MNTVRADSRCYGYWTVYSENRLALLWILDSMRCRYLGNVDHYQYEVNLDVDHYQYEGQHILKLYIDTR